MMPGTEAAATPPQDFYIVLNAGSGHDDAADTRALIEREFAAQQGTRAARAHILLVDEPAGLAAVAARAVAQAAVTQGAVVAAGGDGTLRTVAEIALAQGVSFGVLPQGTFNYFARAHGIPLDTAEAVRYLLQARPQPVQVGLANARVFLVNASLGLYPALLEDREAFKQQYGRTRPVAIWAALWTLFRRDTSLHLRMQSDGHEQRLRTPTLFVGNNALQLEQVGVAEADAPAQGLLAAIFSKRLSLARRLGILLLGASGRLGEAEAVSSFRFSDLTLRHARGRADRPIKLATDGETCMMEMPLRVRVSPQALHLLRAEVPVTEHTPAPEPAYAAAPAGAVPA